MQHGSAEFFEHDFVLQQVLLHLGDLRRGKVDLIDGNDDRYAGALRMRDRFDGLRHDLVVGCDHNDDDVGDLSTTGTHGGKRFVTGGVEERDGALVGNLDVIGTNVLRDAAGFARDHVGLSDVIEQRRLPMVNVPHDRDDGRARTEVLGRVLDLFFLQVSGVIAFLDSLEPELAGDQLDLVEVETLIDGDHEAKRLEREADDLSGGNAKDLGEFRDRDELVDADGFAFLLDRGNALLLHLGAHVGSEATSTTAARRRASHGGHRLRDVGRHGFLIDATLALFATTLLTLRARGHPCSWLRALSRLPALASTRRATLPALRATRTTVIATLSLAESTTGSGGRDRTSPTKIRRPTHSAWARCPGDDGTRTWTIGG